MRKSTGFIAASGFISAILLVWAQQWFGSRIGYAFDWSSSLALIWTYFAVLISLTSLAIALYSDLKRAEAQVPILAMYLLGISFGMAIVLVVQSLCSNVIFLTTGAASIPDWLAGFFPYEQVKWGFIILAPTALLIIFFIVRFFVRRIIKPSKEAA